MSLAKFHVTASPGELRVRVNAQEIPAAKVLIEADFQQVPTLAVWAPGAVSLAGEGVVQVVRDPTAEEIDQAAVGAIARIDREQFAQTCQAKISRGRRDPWQVALETLVEMADG